MTTRIGYRVSCSDPSCGVNGPWSDHKSRAVRKWNDLRRLWLKDA
jgi:hypothetical protein